MAIRTGYNHGQFCWVDLVARDMQEAREFYNQLFGWDSVDIDSQEGHHYAHFELAERSVAGVGQMNDEMKGNDRPAMWNSYINVDDIEAVCAKATELGAKITVPIMKAREAGSLAFVQDPTGAQFGLWQKGNHFGAALNQDLHSFCWNELCTRDIERAMEFYGRLLDWEFSEYASPISKYYVVKNRDEENSGLMEIDQRWGGMPPCWMVYFAVQSVDFAVDQVRQLGGYVIMHPTDIPEGRMAVVADVQGAVLELVEMTDEGEE